MSNSEDVTLGLGDGVELSPENLATIEREIAAGRIIVVPTEAGPTPYVRFGPGRAVPLTIEYEGTGGSIAWSMTVQVMGDGQARCVRLDFDAAKGAYINSKTLRTFPWNEKIKEALLLFAVELDDNDRPIGPPIRERVTTLPEARRVHRAIEREHRKRQRGSRKTGRVTDEKLREVARVYREAVTAGKPTDAVAAHFKVARSTAGRWVVRARGAGYLRPAPGKGIPGEINEKEEQDG